MNKLINELLELADTSENARKIKSTLTSARGRLTTDQVYELYDLFEDSRAYGYVQSKLARL